MIRAIALAAFLAAPALAQTDAPFSPVVEANGVLYVAGQLGYDKATRAYPDGGIGPQTAQALDNIKAILEGENSGMEDVVRCRVFLTDPQDFSAMNAVYRTYFPGKPPARTTVAVALVSPEAKIEIECTAVRGHGDAP